MILRKACAEEAKTAYQCIEDARAYHRSLGFVQWHPGYPTLATIEEDIEAGIGYVFADGNEICGYCCIIIGDEPAYHVIDGAWSDTQDGLFPAEQRKRVVRKRRCTDQRVLP